MSEVDGVRGLSECVDLADEMRSSYLDYAMSVIVSRALPDVRDGLKPVHRRILYGMNESGCHANKPYRKSARIVGDVMGKYHPHGDAPIYEAMVRMAQPFSMRMMLVDGQGNFGSIDGDSAAAMRYTEARMSRLAHTMLSDIDSETVAFQPNYDNSTVEPVLLPARFPNLLVNGAGGIAVGMATNIPTHNIGEVVDAALALLRNREITLAEILEIIPGPDFPTGGIIVGRGGIVNAFKTGRGSLIIRSKVAVESCGRDRQALVVSEIPYQVNKARLVERIADVVNEKIVEGISDLRDESDRDGIRIVIELKRDANADVVLNQLYRHTQLQTSFGVNMLALHNSVPRQMGLLDILGAFLDFRVDVVTRRTRFELRKARERAHMLIGLAIAVANIDEVISLIKSSVDSASAKKSLMERAWAADDISALISLVDDEYNVVIDGKCHLTDAQAQGILDLRLHRLTALERDKISDELREISARIEELLSILCSKEKVEAIIESELIEIRESFVSKRQTTIDDSDACIDDEDLIQPEDVVVTVSHSGYIKRVPENMYRAQRRGGKGRNGMDTKDDDFVSDVFTANTLTPLLFFSTKGKVYQQKVYKLPQGSVQSRGRAINNLLPLDVGEKISAVLALPTDDYDQYDMVFATSHGTIRRNRIDDFVGIKSNGKMAMKLENGEKLIAVAVCRHNDDVMLSSRYGKCVRFSVSDLRIFASRSSTGVRGMRLLGDDEVISMAILPDGSAGVSEREKYIRYTAFMRRNEVLSDEVVEKPEHFDQMKANEVMILTVTENGFGKCSSSYEYRVTSRGVQGVKNIEMSERNGDVIAVLPVKMCDDVMLVTSKGQMIRCPVSDIRITSRGTQGVILFRIASGEKVVSATRLIKAWEE